LNAQVIWDHVNQVVVIKTETNILQLPVNNNTAIINDSPLQLDVPAQIINGRTMVPIRIIAEQFHVQVQWNNATRTVTISK